MDFASQDLTAGQLNAIVKKLGGKQGSNRFLRGALTVSEKSSRILSVDRRVKPVYPNCMKELLHPGLEATGPEQYDPSLAPLYYHPKQKNGGGIKGIWLYAFLKEAGLIEHCYSLRDGEELTKNPSCYPESWKGKTVTLWKSVALSHDGILFAPYVHWTDIGVCLGWREISDVCSYRTPVALSAS